MRRRIEKYRDSSRRDPSGQYEIGCLMITSPVFFREGDWVAQPVDWKGQTVQGRGQSVADGDGARILRECLDRSDAGEFGMVHDRDDHRGEPRKRFGAPTLVTPRLGQGTFRVAVTDAYRRACAVTNEHSLPVLEAAHIRPYSREGAHDVSNGLLLRSDLHRLFDKGYVTISPDLTFDVSPRLRADFDNGKHYYQMVGKPIALPRGDTDRPSAGALQWHRENVYLS